MLSIHVSLHEIIKLKEGPSSLSWLQKALEQALLFGKYINKSTQEDKRQANTDAVKGTV